MFGLVIGGIFGYALFQNYIRDYTKDCQGRLAECIATYNAVVPTAKYGLEGNLSFMNITGVGT